MTICPIDQQPYTFPPDAHNGNRCNERCSTLLTLGVTNVTLDKPTEVCFNGAMTNEHTLPVSERRLSIGFTDLRAAIRHDANIARKEGFLGVAERADNILRDLDRIDDEFTRKHQVGYKVEIVITPLPIDLRHHVKDQS